jgi:hypothetical protein
MLARHITREPELPDPKEPDTAYTFVFKHDAFLRMLASVRPGPSESIRRLHTFNLPESGDFVSFRYEVASDPRGTAPHPPDTRDGTRAPYTLEHAQITTEFPKLRVVLVLYVNFSKNSPNNM